MVSLSQGALVSILIPCFDTVTWVRRAIETALAQTWLDKEVIVLDDGSTDGSIEVIRQYASHLRIETQANGGQNVSRNRLTELSRGEWLVYLDADDELVPDSIEKKMALTSEADAIYGTIEVACFVGEQKTRFSMCPAVDFSDPMAAAFRWSFPNTSAFLFRRSAILDSGGWNTMIKNCTDYDMYFKLLLKEKKFRAAPGALSMYRQWSPNQAVYQDPLRKSRTRLQLMWAAARELQATKRLTADRKEAFEQATFGVIRMMALFDLDEASQQYQQLLAWEPDFHPKSCTAQYQTAYRLGGFEFAERFAGLIRRLNPIKKPQPGMDPESGLPYV